MIGRYPPPGQTGLAGQQLSGPVPPSRCDHGRRLCPVPAQEHPGSKRKDDENVIQEFKDLGYTFVGTSTEMKAASSDKPLLGLFHTGTMNVYLDREILKDPQVLKGFTDQPNLMDMTKKSLDILSKNPNGFFAMIEGASIDKQLHVMDWQRAAYDTIEFDKAIQYAEDWNRKRGNDTLIIVLADHAHGVSISGTYHERDGKKGTEAVRVYQNSVFPTFKDENHDGFPDKSGSGCDPGRPVRQPSGILRKTTTS